MVEVMSQPKEKIAIHISCKNLKKLDLLSKSDPQCHFFLKQSSSTPFALLGKTEKIKNNHDPEFTKSFEFDYFFEKEQVMKVEIWDVDGESADFVGEYQAQVGKLMTSPDCKLTEELHVKGKPQKRGSVVLKAEIPTLSNIEISFNPSASLTSLAGCCGEDLPFLQIEKRIGQEWVRAWKTERGRTHTPAFQRVQCTGQVLCEAGNEEGTELRFSLLNYKENGNHQQYGSVLINMQKLKTERTHMLDLSQGNMLKLENFFYQELPSFLDYLRSGWFINMAAAIDYTASNGELSQPDSLHKQYNDGQTMNDYEKAISSVGSVLEPYAYLGQIAAFGFGGVPRFAGQNSANHCFNLTGTSQP